MKTTVIIPAYKAGWCLDECLASIGRQTVRPNKILIGCDACPESAAKALELKAEFAKTSRRRHTIKVDVYYFPNHVGPFRIRNMLALMAEPGTLLFFDADDIMYPDFVEVMTKDLTPAMFITPEAHKTDLGQGNLDPWQRAHGILGIHRHTFIQHGGFEGWECGADSEANQRWEQGGLTRYRTTDPVMLVRKHGAGLTAAGDTGYGSPKRRACKAEIAKRRKTPVRTDRIAIADCCRVAKPADLEPDAICTNQRDWGCHNTPTAFVEVREAPEDAGDSRAIMHIRALLSVTERGFEARRRKIVTAAERYLQEWGKKGG